MLRKWAGKWKKQILCILAGLALGGLAFYMEQAGSQVGQGYLERMGYGEEGKTYEFLVEGIWDEAVACEVEISPGGSRNRVRGAFGGASPDDPGR